MTDPQPAGAETAAQQALRTLADNGSTTEEEALETLAATEVLLPMPTSADAPESPEPETVSLPVVAQADGTQLVPVFTTQARMEQAFPTIERHSRVQLGALARGWPSEELSLVIDAGTPEEVGLTAQGVRGLLVRG